MAISADEINDLATATMSEVVSAAHDQYDKVLAVIRRNPLTSAGVALGVGFVVALLAKGSTAPTR